MASQRLVSALVVAIKAYKKAFFGWKTDAFIKVLRNQGYEIVPIKVENEQ